jgi:hypothetical protein
VHPLKKFVFLLGFAFAVVGAMLTIVVLATMTSESFPFSFGFGMTVIAPSITVGRALGIQDGMHAWLWASLAILLNTFLCFSAGALAGSGVYFVTKARPKSNENAS